MDLSWATTLLGSAAEITIVREALRPLLTATATDNFVTVETADTRVSPPDRVFSLTIQIEGDTRRHIPVICWENLTSSYDILLAETDWLPPFKLAAPKREDVILPSFSAHVPSDVAQTYAEQWALSLAPAVYLHF